ncbi:MAG: hypothetical protein MUF00_09055, partial [Gemmatimonadaceae bacterium]|nr:hypothetical protein [Gemmatimonadaceae bacterium]
LLEAVIMEGVADYVASRLVPDGGVLESGHQRFGRANAARVRAAFAEDLRAGRDPDRWLYNYGKAGADWVPDLGYFVGFRIAEGYHTRHGGTDAALRRLIAMTDARRILRESGYLRAQLRADRWTSSATNQRLNAARPTSWRPPTPRTEPRGRFGAKRPTPTRSWPAACCSRRTPRGLPHRPH